jgi:hypothetical protein
LFIYVSFFQKKDQGSPGGEQNGEIVPSVAEKEKEKKKSDQKTLFNFFVKKTEKNIGEKSVSKHIDISGTGDKKSVFKCIGSAPIKQFSADLNKDFADENPNQREGARLMALERVLARLGNEMITDQEWREEFDIFKRECRYQKSLSRKRRAVDGKRKVFIHFAESSASKPSLIIFNKTSFAINRRRPFMKDEMLVDYEIDSDEELEEKVVYISCLLVKKTHTIE